MDGGAVRLLPLRAMTETVTLVWCGHDGEPRPPAQTVVARVTHRNAALVYATWTNSLGVTETLGFDLTTGWPDGGRPEKRPPSRRHTSAAWRLHPEHRQR